MTKHWKMIGAVVAALGLVLASALTVAAQGPRGRALPEGLPSFEGAPAIGRLADKAGALYHGSAAIAEALGLTEQELREQLRGGATLADLAEAQGIALAELRALAQSERQATMLERLSQTFEDSALADRFCDWFRRGASAGYLQTDKSPWADSAGVAAAAQALGMEPEDVELQLWAGRTLADLAERAGVESADVQAAVEAAQKSAAIERVQQAVESGALTAEQATWLIEGIENGYQGAGRLGAPLPGRGRPSMMRGSLRPEQR